MYGVWAGWQAVDEVEVYVRNEVLLVVSEDVERHGRQGALKVHEEDVKAASVTY